LKREANAEQDLKVRLAMALFNATAKEPFAYIDSELKMNSLGPMNGGLPALQNQIETIARTTREKVQESLLIHNVVYEDLHILYTIFSTTSLALTRNLN
jgi:hypothetical protein